MQWITHFLEWLTRPRVSAIEQEATILLILSHGREMYGLDIQEAAPDILNPGSIYVRLSRLLERGLISARYETDAEKKYRGPRRRLYKITQDGRRRRAELEQLLQNSIRGMRPATN